MLYIIQQSFYFYRFYVTFVVGTRLKVGETKSISVLLESLRIKSSQMSSEEKAKQLEILLRAVLNDGSSNASGVTEPEYLDGQHLFVGRRTGGNAGAEWTHAMKVASRLLVDLSTLQTFFQASSAASVLDADDTQGKCELLYVIEKLLYL